LSEHIVAELVLAFAGLYPLVTSGLWIAGAFLFRVLDEPSRTEAPVDGWPGVTILPATAASRSSATRRPRERRSAQPRLPGGPS
jgi:hypothetical protein